MIILPIRRVAVLGCGAMGRQMAALCANAGLEVDLFGLPRPNGAPGHQACQALETLRSAWPPPLACPEAAHAINPCDYAHHLDHLRRCDLVVEAVAEQRDTKLGFLARIVPHLQRWTLIATTTESLSVAELALALPEGLRERFCGVHCFLPLRYRTLVELVPGERTDPRVLDALEDFCVTVLGRDVVRAFDRSISMAERIDLFATASALHYTQAFDLLPEAVDALAGPFIERPLARIERRGWDDFTRRLARAHATLADDPWRERFTLPSGLVHHLAAAEEAIHRVEGGVTRVFDLKAGRHPPALSPAVSAPQPEDGGLDLEQQPFTWALWRDVCHYCAHHLADLAPCARHVDHALRLGAGWPLGPFEHWQQLGWQTVAKAIAADIEAGDTPVALPLPSWALAIDAVHTPRGSYAPERRRHCPRSSLACYRRQDRVLPLVGEAPVRDGLPVLTNPSITLTDGGNGVGVLTLHAPRCVLDKGAIDGLQEGLQRAQEQFVALVLWGGRGPFCVGVALDDILGPKGLDAARFDDWARRLQELATAVRRSGLAVIAAVHGAALGPGFELVMAADGAVVTLESQLGLGGVVGLPPMAGGAVELARRAAQSARRCGDHAVLAAHFATLAGRFEVCQSAHEARTLGLLRERDNVVIQSRALLTVAKVQALALADSGYRPPPVARIAVPGGRVMEVLTTGSRGAGVPREPVGINDWFSGHLSRQVAEVLGGGCEVEGLVDEVALLRLEREVGAAFLASAPPPPVLYTLRHRPGGFGRGVPLKDIPWLQRGVAGSDDSLT